VVNLFKKDIKLLKKLNKFKMNLASGMFDVNSFLEEVGETENTGVSKQNLEKYLNYNLE